MQTAPARPSICLCLLHVPSSHRVLDFRTLLNQTINKHACPLTVDNIPRLGSSQGAAPGTSKAESAAATTAATATTTAPTVTTAVFNAGIMACARAGQLGEGMRLLREMWEQEVSRDVQTYNTAMALCKAAGEWTRAVRFVPFRSKGVHRGVDGGR